ncbi:hypothetical protein HYH02_006647 [Chlamydomonas schloesseri]|uniref:Guanylate cyclase domain-containing protein n=1 Tax=Chlamydomonas schloesseri TaxID=2026947 RepID=A0A835W0M6_9CHLO|nr:hypothetical protein HYH02_006647 [Chlamydomonas schloesseri]|eukprot:KAG2432659.1 hypothetical protein HYH02_006647 [Chlamydomonas schloesseri]
MPAVMLANFISLYPDWSQLSGKLPGLATKLLATNGAQHTQTLEVAPFAVYAGAYPTPNVDTNPPGIGERAAGEDLLSEAMPPLRNGVLGLITLKTPYVQLTGPYLDRSGNNILLPVGLHSIVMVFVADVDANATFNNPAPGPTNCPVCYDPVRRQKFWGAVGCTVDWRGLRDTARWERYADMGYHYRLTRFSTFINETILLAGSEQVPGDSLYFSVPVAPDISWTLAMGRVGGWVPPWRNPLLGVVVAVSLLVPALLFLLIIKQRQHTSLLHSIVPKQAVRYLACGRKYARSFNNVTVLFSDIVRYTELSSGLTALQVVELLDEVYAAFDLLCEAHGIYRCDVIGDAYMAVAGIPESEPPHQAAVRAARMAQAMIQVTRRMVTKSGIQIQIRVGCHSGPLVAAVLGSHSSPKYTVLGDTVNTASRMESSSEPMCIQVSAVTAQLLGEAGVPLELRPRGDINIKGKGVMATSWLDPEVGSSLPRPAATAPTAGSSSGGAATAPVAHRRSGSMKRLSVLLSGAAPQHPAISAPCHTVLEVESAPNNVGGSAATLGVRGGSDSDSGGGGGMVAGADDDDDAAAAKSGAVAGVERLMFVGDLDHSIPSIRPVKPEEWA